MYLLKGQYRYNDATETAFWCGPMGRCPSGLQLNEPGTSTLRQWECRLSGASLKQAMQTSKHPFAVADGFKVEVACGGSQSDDLHTRALDGDWSNWPVVVWAYDLTTDDYEEVFRGRWSRGPDGGSRDRFSLSANAGPGGLDSRLKMTQLDASGWTASADWNFATPSNPIWTGGNADGEWYPPGALGVGGGFDIHPDLENLWVGPIFGEGSAGWAAHTQATNTISGTEYNGVFREVYYYGVSPDYFYLHVSPIGDTTNGAGFVYDLVIRTSGGEDVYSTGGGMEIANFINTDPAKGPVGHNIRVSKSVFGSVNWRNGDRHKAYALVSGHYSAGVGGTNWNAATNPFLNSIGGNGYDPTVSGYGPEVSQTPRMAYKEILSDLLTDSDFTEQTLTLGTGALTAFESAAPATSAAFKNRVCALPLEAVDERPKLRDIVGELLVTLLAGMVQKWDSSAGQMAWYPVWRRPFSTDTASDATPIRSGWLRSEDPPSIQWADDPFREYANVVTVRGPTFFVSPFAGANSSADPETFTDRNGIVKTDASGVAAFNGEERARKVSAEYWHHYDPTTGASAAAYGLGTWATAQLSECSQKQRYWTAQMGPRGLTLNVGDLVRYVDIERVTTDIGQVRNRALRLDDWRVTITTWHGTITYS